MKLEDLVKLHNGAIGAMNAANESVSYLETALRKAREGYETAVKNELAIREAVMAADRAQRGIA